MEQFTLIPTSTIVTVLAVATALLLAGFVVLGARNRLLSRLGVRNIARRRARAILIAAGLTVSTTVAGGALGAGDTITYTLQSLVVGSLGSVDEVIVLNPPRSRLMAQVRAITQPGFGGLAAARLDFFPEDDISRVKRAARDSPAIAGIAPAIVEQVTVIHGPSRQLQSALPLLAIAPAYPAAFGSLEQADGTQVALDALGPTDVVLNAAAAELFAASAGQPLQIVRGETTINGRIYAVTRNGGLGGGGPLVIVPLRHYQRTTNHSGEINQILVANHGGSASVERSPEATRDLRVPLVDRDVARQLHALIRRADVQRGLMDVEANMSGSVRAGIAALRTEGAHAEMTDQFVSLLSAPRMRQRLFSVAWDLPASAGGRSAPGLLRQLSTLSVLDVKQEALVQAQTFGTVITTVFLVLGIFSLAAAVLLIFLIFTLLAADRSVELATMRALGMRRSQVMGIFLVEGLIYNVIGAALGTLFSLLAVNLLARSVGEALEPFGVQLARHVEPRSLLLAFTLGILVTFGAMVFAAWRVSHREIVAGTRGEARDERTAWSLLLVGTCALVAAGLLWWRWHQPAVSYEPRHPLVVPGTLSLIVLGLTCWAGPILRTWGAQHQAMLKSLVTAIASLLIGGIWLRTLGQITAYHGELRVAVITVAVSTVMVILATVIVVAQALGPAMQMLDYGLAWAPRIRALARPAASYLHHQRSRAALTIAMFGMVICIMVAALTLIDVIVTAYAGDEPPVGGYDLRADLPGGNMLPDMTAALADAPAISSASFRAFGGIAPDDVQSVQLGTLRASWRPATLVVADDGFLGGIRAGMAGRAAEHDNDSAVWEAVRTQPGLAVIAGRLLTGIPPGGGATIALLDPITLWVRPNSGGPPLKLTVAGMVDPRSELEAGIYVSQATAAELRGTVPSPTTYYFTVAPGTRIGDAAQGLRISFGELGMSVSELDETQQVARSIRMLLTGIVQGFMGIGLLAGIAALGLLGVQSVLERRQQLGMLRALGFTRRQMRATLVWEGATTGLLGVGVGLVLGLILARSVVTLLAAVFPEVRFAVPWPAIVNTIALALAGSAGAIYLAAWQAGRVSPAEALRVEG